jgi:7,8-dihydropterin-6-yl-methyl-4-(beta-D-ribofuranosyl)aminobenzene 5'-phosphate synthase
MRRARPLVLALAAVVLLASGDARVSASPPIVGEKLDSAGSVPFLRILPLVEASASRAGLAREGGVSYLIDAGDARILFDLGLNKSGRNPWTLEANARSLGASLAGLRTIFISHDHSDHTGGSRDGSIDLGGLERAGLGPGMVKAFIPRLLSCSGAEAVVADRPVAVAPGVASLGSLPMAGGSDVEQTLAVKIEGLGLALVSGCGHPGLDRILQRAGELFDAPIFAVLGGLHYRDANESRVQADIDLLKRLGVAVVGLSPHDSTPRAIAAMRAAFGEGYRDIEVGREITLAAGDSPRAR